MNAPATSAGKVVPLLHPLVLASLFLLTVVIAQASVMEDAYITFRVVENFINGEGLRWNLHERVQVYTNPLWLLVHIPFYAVYDNIVIDTTIIGLICTELVLLLVFITHRTSSLAAIALFVLPLACSRSFAVYSTSGFENPMGHVLFAWFGWALIAQPKRFWLHLALATSLSMVNRLDTAVFYLPVWAYLLYTRYPGIAWRQLFVGALPIVGWELFSLLYYGFLFPNTKYAKLNTGVEGSEYLQLGVSYLMNIAAVDVASALLLVAALVCLPVLLVQYCRSRDDRTGLYASLAAGIAAYMVYVVLIGGTYLSGRLLSLQILAAAWLLLALLHQRLRMRNLYVVAASVCTLTLFWPSTAAMQSACPSCFKGVDSIHAEVKDGLLDYIAGKAIVPAPGSLKLPNNIHLEWSMGKWGWAVDRSVKVVDGFAIVDPLLARLPMAAHNITTMGITTRSIPQGYFDFLKTGEYTRMDPELAQYYRKLRVLIADDLWSWERMGEILKFNLGAYDYLRDQYVLKTKRAKALEEEAKKAAELEALKKAQAAPQAESLDESQKTTKATTKTTAKKATSK